MTEDGQAVKNIGWRVVFAGLGINLALGVLYSWSVISGEIAKTDWGGSWTATERSLPYRMACLVFCLIMVPAGRMQDKLSPKLVATIGGVLVGIGMIVASQFESVMGYVIGFGVLAGAGIGFGYASATPPAVKWFPKAKTGMIAGLVVSGFGLASLYAAPLSKWLASEYSLSTMMMVLGIGFFVMIVGIKPIFELMYNGLAGFLETPPPGYKPEVVEEASESKKDVISATAKKEDFLPSEMLKTWQFYVIWFMYACGAGAGLMIISCCKGIVKGAGLTEAMAVAAVMGLAVGNGGGRVVAGILSDKLGRNKTMLLFFVLQALAILGLYFSSVAENPIAVLLLGLAGLVGANYGSNLALFPSVTKDFFGLKNFGVNYGLVFTAWGIGGYTLALFAAKVLDKTQSYGFAFKTSAVLMIVAGALTFVLKAPEHKLGDTV